MLPVLLGLTALGLETGRDVGGEGAVLALDSPHLDLQPGGVGLAAVLYSKVFNQVFST